MNYNNSDGQTEVSFAQGDDNGVGEYLKAAYDEATSIVISLRFINFDYYFYIYFFKFLIRELRFLFPKVRKSYL